MTHLDKAATVCPGPAVLAEVAGRGFGFVAADLGRELFWATLDAHLQWAYNCALRRSTEWERHNAR